MSHEGRRFCLITAGNVSNRPRLLKAADALAAGGHRVRVIGLDIQPHFGVRDDDTVRGRLWVYDRVRLRRGTIESTARRALASGTQSLARRAVQWGVATAAVEDHALCRYLWPLVRRVLADGANVIGAHGLEALPVAARAAARVGARLAFDSEDLHSQELPDLPRFRSRAALVRAVEQRYLSLCYYLTAASDGIADALVEIYGVRRPTVILNTFLRAERTQAPTPTPAASRQRRVSLYWFSQVIGPGRGIEDAVRALALIPQSVELHLRGEHDPTFVKEIRRLAGELKVADRFHLMPTAAPGELVRLAEEHDIGLALERPVPGNRNLCVTNKLFVYLLAGLAVAATETQGQRGIMQRAPGAGFLYPPGDVAALAAGIRSLIETPGALARAKVAAAAAADRDFVWDHEAPRLVRYLVDGV